MYVLIFIFWLAAGLLHHESFLLAVATAAIWTVAAMALVTIATWALMALGVGTYGIFKLFKKLF